MKDGMKKIVPKKPEKMQMDEPMPPHLHLSFKELPEAKDWRVGRTYQVKFNLKQVGMSVRGPEDGSVDFEINGYEVLKESKPARRYA